MLAASVLFIFFSATAGFAFVSKCYAWSYKLARESGHKLYLSCLFFGFTFFVIVVAFAEVLGHFSPFLISDTLKVVIMCFSTIVLAYVVATVYNKAIPNCREINIDKVWQKNDFDRVCANAMLGFKPIAVSPESRKVYVGYVMDALSCWR